MIVTRPSGRRLSVGAVVVGVDVLLELPKGSLVDAGGGLDGGPRYGAVEEPLDGSNTSLQFSFVQTLSVPYQFSFPATFLETVLKTFSAASFDQLLQVIHHISPSAPHVTPERLGEYRKMPVRLRRQQVRHVLDDFLECPPRR